MLFQSNSKPYHISMSRSNKVQYYSKVLNYLHHIILIFYKTLKLFQVDLYKNDNQLSKLLIQYSDCLLSKQFYKMSLLFMAHSSYHESQLFQLLNEFQTSENLVHSYISQLLYLVNLILLLPLLILYVYLPCLIVSVLIKTTFLHLLSSPF